MGVSSAEIAEKPREGAGLQKIVSALDKINPITKWLFYIAGAVLFLYTMYMFLDVILRYIFDKPLPASIDIGGIVLEILLFFGLGYIQVKKRHLTIDILTSRLGAKAKLILSMGIYIVSFALMVVLVWRGIISTLFAFDMGSLSYTGWPTGPSQIIIPFGCFFMAVVLLRDIFAKMIEALQMKLGVISWILMLAIPIGIIVFIWYWVQPMIGGGNLLLIGGLCILLTIVFSFIGIPLAIALVLMTFVLTGYASGIEGAYMVIGDVLYSQASNYNFAVIPLFVLMAYFIIVSGLGTDAYLAAFKWIGHWRGGLGVATVIASAGLAAVEGTGTAAIITLGPVAVPEMRKYKYDDGMACGVVAAGATLGPMIPPSLGFIMFGILASTSIGQLFIAGILPGIILAVLFILTIVIWTRINPSVAPAGEKSSWGERFKSLPAFLPIIVLFILIIGGIYAGVFSAMEGGGIGATVALIIALIMRRVTWQKFKNAILDSMNFVTMLLFVVVAGLIFGNALGSSGISNALIAAIKALGISQLMFLGIIIVIYLIWGVICDAPIIVILTTPVLAPIAKEMGIDLVWFGILTTACVNMGSITPPYAMGIFMLRSILPDIPLSVMYKGILPYVIASLVLILLILFIPQIALWLPGLM